MKQANIYPPVIFRKQILGLIFVNDLAAGTVTSNDLQNQLISDKNFAKNES
jgi:hypothetical protein